MWCANPDGGCQRHFGFGTEEGASEARTNLSPLSSVCRAKKQGLVITEKSSNATRNKQTHSTNHMTNHQTRSVPLPGRESTVVHGRPGADHVRSSILAAARDRLWCVAGAARPHRRVRDVTRATEAALIEQRGSAWSVSCLLVSASRSASRVSVGLRHGPAKNVSDCSCPIPYYS